VQEDPLQRRQLREAIYDYLANGTRRLAQSWLMPSNRPGALIGKPGLNTGPSETLEFNIVIQKDLHSNLILVTVHDSGEVVIEEKNEGRKFKAAKKEEALKLLERLIITLATKVMTSAAETKAKKSPAQSVSGPGVCMVASVERLPRWGSGMGRASAFLLVTGNEAITSQMRDEAGVSPGQT
jgi:hypothetical protein